MAVNPYTALTRYVIDPVPKSLKNIKVVQTLSVRGYGYVFGFKINEEDLNLIIESRHLKMSKYLRYSGTYLEIDYDSSKDYAALLFQPNHGIKEPKWFHPQSCSTYALVGDNFHEILLYNKNKGEAYFCTRHWK